MQFTLTIKMDNAAFEESNSDELARILSNLAGRLDESRSREIGDGEYIHDVNGNRVGNWEVTAD